MKKAAGRAITARGGLRRFSSGDEHLANALAELDRTEPDWDLESRIDGALRRLRRDASAAGVQATEEIYGTAVTRQALRRLGHATSVATLVPVRPRKASALAATDPATPSPERPRASTLTPAIGLNWPKVGALAPGVWVTVEWTSPSDSGADAVRHRFVGKVVKLGRQDVVVLGCEPGRRDSPLRRRSFRRDEASVRLVSGGEAVFGRSSRRSLFSPAHPLLARVERKRA